jgi:hypothetical protein
MILKFLFGGGDPSRDCSREALEKNDTEKMRDIVLEAYDKHVDATADEIAEFLGLSVLQVRPRVAELKRMGYILPTGARRKNANGNSCAVMCFADNVHGTRTQEEK